MPSGVCHAPPNNGMHPTADTLLLKFLQWRGAAGDAWRYAAFRNEEEHSSVIAL